MEPSRDVKDAFVELLATLAGGDAGAVMARIAAQPGTIFFGSAAEEWVTGPAEIQAFMDEMVPVLHRAGLTFRPGDPQAFREGNIGWVVGRMAIHVPSGAEREVRATAVFCQRAGRWKTVLYGHSLAVPDDQVEVFRELVG